MGKKPVVGLIGLVWAGIALTGCGECCRNCHNKFNAAPTFSSKNTPTPIGSPPAPSVDSHPAPTPVSKASELPKSFSSDPGVQQTSSSSLPGADVPSADSHPPVSSLRPKDDGRPMGSALPTRMDDGLASPACRTSSCGEGQRMSIPPTPVSPSLPPEPTPAASSGSLPPIGSSSSLPSAPPPPPGTMPTPRTPGMP